MSDTAIEVDGLRKLYGDNNVAVDGLELTVRRGEIFALLGPNGRRQDHHDRDPRGLPPARRRHGDRRAPASSTS